MSANSTPQLGQITKANLLPMSGLEQELKNVYSIRKDIHGRVLTSDELQEYYAWMARNFASSAGARSHSPATIMEGNIGLLTQQLLHNPTDADALAQLSALSKVSSESNSFAAGHDIVICQPLRYLPPYWHTSDYFEVYYVFSGPCPVYFENETVVLEAGDVIIIPPFTKNATSFISDDVVLLDIMIRSSTFQQVFLEQLAPSNLMTMFFTKALSGSKNSSYLRFQTETDEALEQILFSMYTASLARDPYSARMRNPLMSTFFLLLLKKYEHVAQTSSQSNLHWKKGFAEILIHIQTNYRTVTLHELSDKFNYSPRQLMRIIRSSTDKSFTELLTQLKMEKAAALLKNTDMPTEEVAAEVGYGSLSNFYRVFDAYYGVTPKKCRSKEWRPT